MSKAVHVDSPPTCPELSSRHTCQQPPGLKRRQRTGRRSRLSATVSASDNAERHGAGITVLVEHGPHVHVNALEKLAFWSTFRELPTAF